MFFGGPPMGGGGRFGGMRGNMTPEEKAKVPKITKELLKRSFSYLLPYWKQLTLVIIIIIITSIMSIVPSMITAQIIDKGFMEKQFDVLIQMIILSFAVFIVSSLIGVLQDYINTWIAQHIVYDMRNQMYRHLEFMSHRFFTTEKQGDLITRMTSDIGGVQGVINGTLTNMFSNIIVLITVIIALYSQNWILATIGILIVPLFIIPTRKVGKKRFDLALKQQAKHDSMNQILNETLSVSGSLLVKLFAKEEEEYQRYEKINGEITRLYIKESVVGRWFRMTFGLFMNMGPVLMYLAGGILLIKYNVVSITPGSIGMMIALVHRLNGPISSLFNVQIDLTRSMALFDRIFTYFDIPQEITNKSNAINVNNIDGDIDFKDVKFHYNAVSPIIKGLSLHIDKGTTVAIVGSSGAGKSTVINLVPRLYDVVEGSVRIDGTDVRDVNVQSLRKHIGFVTQDTYLFNGTIKENLLYANKNSTDEQIINACRDAHIHDYIESLPDKYDSIVGNRGLKLSGGEKQRLSIARVILADPKILLLDEATSALDSISEALIQQAIEPLLKNRTSIVIAHRLSTIMAADEIVVINDGVIAERGKHHELLVNNGVYRELYETQFKHAIEDMEDYKAKNNGKFIFDEKIDRS